MTFDRCSATVTRLAHLLAMILLLAPGASASSKYKILHTFTGPDGGGLPGNVIFDPAGNLYGDTFAGGAHSFGVVFELSPSGNGKWTETVLYNFCSLGGKYHCDDGGLGSGFLAIDPYGDLYGGTGSAGPYNFGTVFELSPGSGGWTYNVIWDEYGAGGLTLDAVGNLYGTLGAGAYDQGAAGELSPGSPYWTYTALYSFKHNGHDGYDTLFPLTFDAAGNLYGANKDFGKFGSGTVYKLMPFPPTPLNLWSEQILHSFPSFPADGRQPYSGLVFDPSGNLYGVTIGGGAFNHTWCPQGCGAVFELTPGPNGAWKETILHRFLSLRDGVSPTGTLAMDAAGNLYGTTLAGGNGQKYCFGGCGTVYKLTPDPDGKWKHQVLHRFTGHDGSNPQAGVILDSQGNLYGTTDVGGAYGAGVVFEITP